MSKEWRDFLTDKEIMKAEKIKDRIENEIWMRIVEEGEDVSVFAGDIVFPCICRCLKKKDAETREYEDVLEKIVDSDTERILDVVCKSNRRHGMCQCPYHQAPKTMAECNEERNREEECWLESQADEELPF